MITCLTNRGIVTCLRSSQSSAAGVVAHAWRPLQRVAALCRYSSHVGFCHQRSLFTSSCLSTRSFSFANSRNMSNIVDKLSNLVVGEQKPKVDPKDETFVGSIDQGTTSSRFLIFDTKGEPVAVHQEEFKQIYPNPGCVRPPNTEIAQG
jgi:hypothetical protein